MGEKKAKNSGKKVRCDARKICVRKGCFHQTKHELVLSCKDFICDTIKENVKCVGKHD